MKRIILTGGGTAGHVTPNIALLPRLKELNYDIHYIGSYNGIEKELIEQFGIPYHGISTGKLRRYFSVQNFTDPFRVIKGLGEAKKLVKILHPDVIFSKGGFVSVPVVLADYYIRREYRGYGCNKSIQRPCYRRSCNIVYYMFVCREIVDDDSDNSGTGYRRNLIPSVWYDRCFWFTYSGRLQSRLRKIQKPDVNIHRICNRSVWNICEYRNRVINRNGSGMCCCHGT